MRLHGTQHSAVNQTLPRNIWNVLCLNALRCHPLLPTQMLTYTSKVLELGGPGAGLVLAAWPALRLLAPELQDPVLSGPLYQAVAAFDDMTQVSRMRGAGRPGQSCSLPAAPTLHRTCFVYLLLSIPAAGERREATRASGLPFLPSPYDQPGARTPGVCASCYLLCRPQSRHPPDGRGEELLACV